MNNFYILNCFADSTDLTNLILLLRVANINSSMSCYKINIPCFAVTWVSMYIYIIHFYSKIFLDVKCIIWARSNNFGAFLLKNHIFCNFRLGQNLVLTYQGWLSTWNQSWLWDPSCAAAVTFQSIKNTRDVRDRLKFIILCGDNIQNDLNFSIVQGYVYNELCCFLLLLSALIISSSTHHSFIWRHPPIEVYVIIHSPWIREKNSATGDFFSHTSKNSLSEGITKQL